MTSAPQNPQTEDTARPAHKPRVLLGPAGGATPADDDETDVFHPLLTERTAGGPRPDYTNFEVDLGAIGDRLVDLQLVKDWQSQVELYLIEDPDGDDAGLGVFWGEYARQTLQLDRTGERAVITAEQAPYLFGGVLAGMEVWDPIDGEIVVVDRDPVFQPEIDGTVEDNRSLREVDGQGQVLDHWIWIDPESVRTQNAVDEQGHDAGQWTLNQAVDTVARIANADETLVTNPDREEIKTLLADAPDLKHVRLPRGRYLPELLDALLEPHGYSWYVASAVDDNDRLDPVITLFKRGDSPEKEVRLQRPGEELDPAKSELPEFSVEQSIAELFNIVEAHGALQQREVTLELFRGWPEDQDGLEPGQLHKTDGGKFENNPNAWRLWVANEAGDWTDTRPEIDDALDLSAVFEEYVPRRRSFEDPLSVDEEGNRRRPFVEWWHAGDEEWKPAGDEWHIELPETQAALYFDGQEPPAEIVAQGADAKVRITATLTGDKRVQSKSDRAPDSPNARDAVLFLDVADRFHDRQRQITGEFATVLPSSGADEQDDQEALDTFVEDVRSIEQAAVVRAELPVFGLTLSYEIGDLITKIDGREISFNQLAPDVQEKQYLQVTGIRLDWQQRRTVLITETFREA